MWGFGYPKLGLLKITQTQNKTLGLGEFGIFGWVSKEFQKFLGSLMCGLCHTTSVLIGVEKVIKNPKFDNNFNI